MSPIALLLLVAPALASQLQASQEAAPDGCAEAVPVSAWVARLDAAEAAFAALDESAFDGNMSRAASDLPCLSAPVDPALAGRYHRLVGLRLYVRGDVPGATLAFAAARAVDPFGALPSALLPPGHEARAVADNASTPGQTERVGGLDGTLWFDGRMGKDRPLDRPTLFQLQDDGVLLASRYLAPGQALPVATPDPHADRWILGGSSLLFATSGVACYALAAREASILDGELKGYTREDVLASQHRANNLVLASSASGLAALGLGIALGVAW